MNNNILIVGAEGQLSNEINAITKSFSRFKFQFATIDDLDITDESAVTNYLNQNKTNYIINCAAYTAVDDAEENEDLAFLVNARGPEILAKVSNELNILLIHISTDYVFDGKKTGDYVENDITIPLSVYGKSKLKGELEVLKNCNTAYVIRTSWLYSSFNANFVKSMLKLAETRKELDIVADQYGSPTYAKDLANVILTIIDKYHRKKVIDGFGIYHYSNEGVTTWYGFAKRIMDEAKTGCIINPISTIEYPLPAARPQNSSMSKEKIKKHFGLKIPTWKESLKSCMNQILFNNE